MDDAITIRAPLYERLTSALPLLVVLAVLPAPIAISAMSQTPYVPWLVLPLLALAPLLGIPAWRTLASRLVLERDSISLFDGFSTRTLRRDEIAGYRFGAVSPLWRMSRLRLVPRDPLAKPMAIGPLQASPVLQPLLDSLVDITAREREAALAEMLDAAGEDGAERFARIDVVSRVLVFASVLAMALFAGPLFPAPLAAGLLAAFPLAVVAFHVWAQGMTRLSLTKDDGDPRPLLGLAYCLPGWALMLRAVTDLDIVDWRPAFVYAAVGGIVLTGALTAFEDYLRGSLLSLAVILIASCAYSFGATLEANALFDRAPARIFTAQVFDARVSHSRRSESYEIYVAPWGPVLHDTHMDVPRALYLKAGESGRVCMVLRPGALGMRWYMPQAC